MKTLNIEWRYLDVSGKTCDRCFDTGKTLKHEISRLNAVLQPRGIQLKLIQTKLMPTQIPQSNAVLIDGVAIEDILPIQVSQNHCKSCSTLVGADSYCRTVFYGGKEYEDIPAKAIRHAIYKTLDLIVKKTK